MSLEGLLAQIEALEDLERVDPALPLDVEVMPDGRVRAERSAARELLRDRLRGAQVLPTGPGWTVLHRPLGSAAPTPAPVEVVMAGSLDGGGLSVVDVVGFLTSTQQTGILAVRTDVRHSLYLRRGDVAWAASSRPLERLGPHLAGRGFLTRAQLQSVLRDGPGGPLRAAVARGFVDGAEAPELVAAFVLERFEALLSLERGTWTFSRTDPHVLEAGPQVQAGPPLMLEALRRLDERRMYRARLGEVASSFIATSTPLPGTFEHTPFDEQPHEVRRQASRVLTAVESPASLADLVRRTGIGEFEVLRALYLLNRAGLLRPRAAPRSPSRVPARLLDRREVLHVHGLAYVEMLAEAERAGRADELLSAVHVFLSGQEPPMDSLELSRSGQLDPDLVLGAAEWEDVETDRLAELLGELLFFMLLQVSDLLGRRRGDDLARRVRLIHAMLGPQRGPSS